MKVLVMVAAVVAAVALPAGASDHCPIHPRQPAHDNLRCAHDTACDLYEVVTGEPLYCR